MKDPGVGKCPPAPKFPAPKPVAVNPSGLPIGYGDPSRGEYNAFLASDGSDLPCD